MALGSDQPATIVVIDRGLRSLCGFLKRDQRTERGRRAPSSEAPRALLAVLGFAGLHRDGARDTPSLAPDRRGRLPGRLTASCVPHRVAVASTVSPSGS